MITDLTKQKQEHENFVLLMYTYQSTILHL